MKSRVQRPVGKYPSGWMSLDELAWLEQQGSRAKLAIEIGSFRGRSATAISARIRGRLYCIDAWRGKRAPELRRFMRNMRRQIAAGRVAPMRTDSATGAIALGRRLGRVFDFVFIDGDHSREGCAADIAAYRQLVRDGGVIAGHDYAEKHPGVIAAVDEAFGASAQRAPGSIWWVQL